ncbi:MAG TPA: hypothetical protein VIK07_10190 [Bacteroidales bacterium]
MDIKYFTLGATATNRFEKIIRIIFGIVCVAIAAFWFSFNIKALKADGTLWITVIFLSGFGFYQIWSGLGRAIRYIEIGSGLIKLKKNPIFPAIIINADEIEKIEIFPFNLIFYLKSKKKIMLRFGATFQETNEKIKDEILEFAELNNITAEFIEEKI